MNYGNKSIGQRIHQSMEARSQCVPAPSPEELEDELGRIMAQGSRKGAPIARPTPAPEPRPQRAKRAPRREPGPRWKLPALDLVPALVRGSLVSEVLGTVASVLHAQIAIAVTLMIAAAISATMLARERR